MTGTAPGSLRCRSDQLHGPISVNGDQQLLRAVQQLYRAAPTAHQCDAAAVLPVRSILSERVIERACPSVWSPG